MNVERRRWWALIAVSLSVLAVGIDGTVLSIALPTLAGVLHASESQLEWFSAGYLLMLAAAVLPVGLFGDRLGRKRCCSPPFSSSEQDPLSVRTRPQPRNS